jgi:hypothetical protein
VCLEVELNFLILSRRTSGFRGLHQNCELCFMTTSNNKSFINVLLLLEKVRACVRVCVRYLEGSKTIYSLETNFYVSI